MKSAVGADHAERLAAIAKERAESRSARLTELQARFEKESDLVDRRSASSARRSKRRCRRRAAAAACRRRGAAPATVRRVADLEALRTELAALNTELDTLQGETPLMRVCVDAQIVGEVISGWTGIPVGKMVRDEIDDGARSSRSTSERASSARTTRSRRSASASARRGPASKIRTSRWACSCSSVPAASARPKRRWRSSDLFYGGEHNLITINMSEFQEAHTVSTLKGSPPGYVGYGEGGVLTEAVRRRPYSVVLLDEVEKAHPDVLELFFQVFDKGMMEDGEGREIDFKNTIIILTTNAGTDR